VLENGFNHESHTVVTEDGYILKIFRIYKDTPYLENGMPRPVVMMQHGIEDSADLMIVNGVEKSFAFILADRGYDVWLGNSRGNKYSQQHIKLDPTEDFAYWDYSFVEMAKYDMPAFIEHIKRVTQLPEGQKITYIGHSQGTS